MAKSSPNHPSKIYQKPTFRPLSIEQLSPTVPVPSKSPRPWAWTARLFGSGDMHIPCFRRSLNGPEPRCTARPKKSYGPA